MAVKNKGTIFVGDPGPRGWYLRFLGNTLTVIPIDIALLESELRANNHYQWGLVKEEDDHERIMSGLSAICNSLFVVTSRSLFDPREDLITWDSLRSRLSQQQKK